MDSQSTVQEQGADVAKQQCFTGLRNQQSKHGIEERMMKVINYFLSHHWVVIYDLFIYSLGYVVVHVNKRR